MEISFTDESKKVELRNYPGGTVFVFANRVYMKIARLTPGFGIESYLYLDLEDGETLVGDKVKEIEEGSVEILDAKLVVSRKK